MIREIVRNGERKDGLGWKVGEVAEARSARGQAETAIASTAAPQDTSGLWRLRSVFIFLNLHCAF